MQAEAVKQEAIRKKIENDSLRLENELKKNQIEREKLEIEKEKAASLRLQAEAFERVKNSINVIKAKGGGVFFDGKQIEDIISELSDAEELDSSE